LNINKIKPENEQEYYTVWIEGPGTHSSLALTLKKEDIAKIKRLK
jgi:hypothetical protein